MKDSFDFSLMDFLAYLFPGTMMILVIALLIKISSLGQILYQIRLNFVVGVILIASAYCVGVSISSAMASIENFLLKFFRLSDPIETIPLRAFDEDVSKAFDNTFGNHGPWSKDHFYLARTLVCERLPECAATLERQASLRQIRRNLVIPVFFLGIAGVVAGLRTIFTNPNRYFLGGGLIILSLAATYIVARALIKHGMHANRNREMREVCSGLLVYDHDFKNSPTV